MNMRTRYRYPGSPSGAVRPTRLAGLFLPEDLIGLVPEMTPTTIDVLRTTGWIKEAA